LSTVPIFTNPDPFDVIELTLQAVFAAIIYEPAEEDAVSNGKIFYVNTASGLPIEADCRIEARRNTRYITAAGDPSRCASTPILPARILEGAGTLVKVITHCFSPDDRWILGGTVAEHDRRLLQEFSPYQVLGAMETAGNGHVGGAMIKYQDLMGADLETPVRGYTRT
jgi:hypothetical protein